MQQIREEQIEFDEIPIEYQGCKEIFEIERRKARNFTQESVRE